MNDKKEIVVLSGAGHKGIVKYQNVTGKNTVKGCCNLDFRPSNAKRRINSVFLVILSVVEGSSVAKREKQICALRLDVSTSLNMTVGWDTHTRLESIGNIPCHSERKRRISWKRNGTIYTSFHIIPLPRDCHAEQVGSQ